MDSTSSGDGSRVPPVSRDHKRAGTEQRLVMYSGLALLSAGLLAYSQTLALEGDEAFHLLAAQLINAGKKPYLDFFYQHVPLYAYLNAAWMRAFGETWRWAHLFSALLTAGCGILLADFVFVRMPDPRWRCVGGILAGSLFILHVWIIRQGTIGQAYGLCLFLSVAAFRFGIRAVRQQAGLWPLWAGLCAGAAAASLLLSAAVAPILLVWLAWHHRRGKRLQSCLLFLSGMFVASLPLLWLAAQAPRQVFFDVIEYHLYHRGLDWGYRWRHDAREVMSWITASQSLLLIVPALVGLIVVARDWTWDRPRKAEIHLCAWLAAGLGLSIACARPTFFGYFVFLVPFLSVLAVFGVYFIASALWPSGRPGLAAAAIIGLYAVAPARWFYNKPEQLLFHWKHFEEIAGCVSRVTPPGGMIYGSEAIYFASRRLPPPGMENRFAHHLKLAPELAASLRVVPQQHLNAWLADGRFATVVALATDPIVDAIGLSGVYTNRQSMHGFSIFWQRRAEQ